MQKPSYLHIFTLAPVIFRDIAKTSSRNLTEVQVDANTGSIVSVEMETPAHEKRESAADKATKK